MTGQYIQQMMKRFTLILAFFSVLYVAHGQSVNNAIQGHVYDLAGNPLPNQNILLFTDSTIAPIAYWQNVTTDANGYYQDSVSYPVGPSFTFYAYTYDCNSQWQHDSASSINTPIIIDFNICTPALPPTCYAGFFWTQNPLNPLAFSFTDTSSTNATSWLWDFGDGSPNGTVQNPNHTFTSYGYYHVCLTIDDGAGCIDSVCDNIFIATPPPTCNAWWTYNPWTNITTATNVVFTDNSSGNIVNWSWDFGDGSPLSTLQNPTHTFNTIGSFNICLTINDGSGCVDSYCRTINVTNCYASFTSTPNALNPQNLQFSDNSSSNSISWSWDFGDGSPVSILQNPSHTFPYGTYKTCLSIDDGAGCTDSVCDIFHFSAPPPTCHAWWTYAPWDAITYYTPASFTDNSSGNIINWSWDFGDGSPINNNQNPTHQFTSAGTYNVCLTINDNSGCYDSYCKNITVKNCNASFVPGVSPNTITGTNTSSGALTYDWLIWDPQLGSTLIPNTTNLLYSTIQGGIYKVCVNAYDSSGVFCDSICHNVYVQSTTSCIAYYYWFPDSINSNLIWVINASSGTNLSYYWDFGDGNFSNQMYPTHTYSGLGPYNLCLTVSSNSPICSDTLCQSITLKTSTGMTINVIPSPSGVHIITPEIGFGDPYPNPSKNGIDIKIPKRYTGSISYAICNIWGETVYSVKNVPTRSGILHISPGNLVDGMYLIQLHANHYPTENKYFMIIH